MMLKKKTFKQSEQKIIFQRNNNINFFNYNSISKNKKICIGQDLNLRSLRIRS